MTNTKQPVPDVHWRLREVMDERGVRSVAALRRLLKDHYPFISEVQLGRVVNRLPERMNMPLFIALCRALECTPSDLMHWGTGAVVEPGNAPRPSKTERAPSPKEVARLKGPAFKVFTTSSQEPG